MNKAIFGYLEKHGRFMSTPAHDDLILTIRVKQDEDTETVRKIVSDFAHDLHLELERALAPSTVIVCSGDGVKDRVVEKFSNE